MKYKNRLIVPTAVAMSLIMTHPAVHADEIESQHDEHPATQPITNELETEQVDVLEEVETPSDEQPSDEVDSVQNSVDIEEPVDSPTEETPPLEEVEEAPETEVEEMPTDEELHTEEYLSEIDESVLNPEETITEENNDEEASLQDEAGTPDLKVEEEKIQDDEKPPELKVEDESIEMNDTDASNEIQVPIDEAKHENIPDTVDEGIHSAPDSTETPEEKNTEIGVKTISFEETESSDDNVEKLDKIEEEQPEKVEQPQFMMSTFALNSDVKVQTLEAEAKDSVLYAARVRSGPNSGRYSPISSDESKALGWLENRTLYVTAESTYNGEKFYRVHSGYDGPMQGWVKEEDLRLFNITAPEDYNKTFDIRLDGHYLTTDPWGTTNQYIKRLDQYGDVPFKASKTLSLGNHTYFYGQIGDDTGWLEKSRLVDTSVNPFYTSAFNAVRIKSGSNSGRYSPVTSNSSKTISNWLKERTLFATEKAKYQGTTYYKVHSGIDGPMQGWIKSEDLRLFNTSKPKTYNKIFDIRLDKHHLTTDPWGTSNQYIKRLDSYGDVPFKASKMMTLSNHTYYYGKIGNDYGWLEQSRLVDTSVNPFYTSAFNAVRIKSGSNSGRYSPVTSNSSKTIGNWLKERTLFATEKAKYQGTTFYKVHSGIDGPMQGWIKSEDLRIFNTSRPVPHSKNYAINQPKHYLLTDPWGTSSQQINRLDTYGSNAVFRAEKSMKLGNHTYYYGKIGNDYGWLEQSRIKDVPATPPASQPEIRTVNYNMSLNQVLNLQMNLSAKPQAWVSGGGWRNATRSEVRHFLDTSHQTGGTWDYTFLNLDQSQGISASVLDRQLLSNRGILTNRGNAFAQAARTHGVNEVYLISHALLETGHGTSQLAQGVRLDRNGNLSNNGTKYYNMYGVGAVDNNALLGGARYAQRMGWDTPEKAIIGGASFVSQNYFNRGQNTLYAMRWNPRNPGTYQYATDVNWAYATARNLESYYRTLGVTGRYFTRYIF